MMASGQYSSQQLFAADSTAPEMLTAPGHRYSTGTWRYLERDISNRVQKNFPPRRRADPVDPQLTHRGFLCGWARLSVALA